MGYVRRSLESTLLAASQHFPVLVVGGARQVGKTTCLANCSAPERNYVSLDDMALLSLARRDPALFFERFPPPVLVDEIQYAPQLLRQIKLLADKLGQPGAFWLSGSQPFELMQGVSESLAGRVGVLRLLGLSAIEKTGDLARDVPFLPTDAVLTRRGNGAPALGLAPLYEHIWRGSFPQLTQDSEISHQLFYASYVQTYLQCDVRQLAAVADLERFARFLRAVAARTAQLLQLSALARDVDVAVNTAKNWLSILQTSGLVYLLEPLHANITKRLIKAPKLYMLDTGLCAHLTEWSTPATLEAGAMAGPILETWVVGEILRSYWHHGETPPVSFYRDRQHHEIDLVLRRDGMLHPIEIKRSANPTAKAVQAFKHLGEVGPVGAGCIISLYPERVPIIRGVDNVPVGWL